MKQIHHIIILLFMTCTSLYGQNHNVKKLLQKLGSQDGCERLVLFSENGQAENEQLPYYWYVKGLCNMQNENYLAAEQDFLKSESLGFLLRSSLYYHLARCETKLERTDQALIYVKKTLELGLPPIIFGQSTFEPLKQNAEYNRLLNDYKPSLDRWTSIFLIIVFQGVLLFFILIFRREGHKKSNLLLALFVLSFAIILSTYVVYWSGYIWVFPFNYFENLFAPLNYAFGPLLFLYIKSLFDKKVGWKNSYYHFIPFTLCFLILVFNHLANGPMALLNNLSSLLFNPWLTMAHMFIYLGVMYVYINKEKYNADSIVNNWMHYLLYAYIGFVLSFLSYFILVQFSFFNLQWDYMISFMISAFIVLISVMGYIQPQIFWGFKVSDILSFVKYEKSGLNESLALELKKKLISLMVDEELFKDSSINLEKLSDKLDTTKHNTSQIINEHFNENFFDFLNDFRIEAAKNLLISEDKSSMNITEVLYEVGFNNKVSFNNAFKKRTGLTPSQFRNEMMQAS